MTTLQNDILEIYNNLLIFNNDTLISKSPIPITVVYEKESNSMLFEQRGNSVRLRLPVYYCLGLEELDGNPTYLLPRDYDYLMSSLSNMIGSGQLIEDRTCLSPENYGFDVFAVNLKEFWKGPNIIGRVRFVSGTSWLFKFVVRRKYKLNK
jgi:hypothetical protein